MQAIAFSFLCCARWPRKSQTRKFGERSLKTTRLSVRDRAPQCHSVAVSRHGRRDVSNNGKSLKRWAVAFLRNGVTDESGRRWGCTRTPCLRFHGRGGEKNEAPPSTVCRPRLHVVLGNPAWFPAHDAVLAPYVVVSQRLLEAGPVVFWHSMAWSRPALCACCKRCSHCGVVLSTGGCRPSPLARLPRAFVCGGQLRYM